MKVILYFPGELAAGIRDTHLDIDIELLELIELSNTLSEEDIKKAFSDLGEALMGSSPIVFLDNECMDCGRRLRQDGTCSNQNCVNYVAGREREPDWLGA